MRKRAWEPILHYDLQRQGGTCCVPGTRVPAETVAGSVWAERRDSGVPFTESRTAAEVAGDYGIDRQTALLCCVWWVRSGALWSYAHRGKRRGRWERWADHAFRILCGYEQGELCDPDDFEERP